MPAVAASLAMPAVAMPNEEVYGGVRWRAREWLSVVLPAMQWFAQAPERALAWWFNKYKHIEFKEKDKDPWGHPYPTVTIKRNSSPLINETKTACQNAISTLTVAKETCASRMAWGEFRFSNYRLKCNGGWFESIADFESANAVVEAID